MNGFASLVTLFVFFNANLMRIINRRATVMRFNSFTKFASFASREPVNCEPLITGRIGRFRLKAL